ncbi:MAG TPA: polyprenyl synthetase family protein [Chloroflexota bacterium]
MAKARMQAGGSQLWRISAEVDRALREFVDRQPVSSFYDVVRYHLGWRPEAPSRLRAGAVLCVLACQACGGRYQDALPAALAIALIRGFAANEQDLECHRAVRHGAPSAWHVWGQAQAMNAGDGLHALAKMALLDARGRLPASAVLHLEDELDECCLRYCEAIHDELACSSGGDQLERTAFTAGVMFGCAASFGCYLAGAENSPADERLREFGNLLGAAARMRLLAPDRARKLHSQAVAALAGAGLSGEPLAELRSLADAVLHMPE